MKCVNFGMQTIVTALAATSKLQSRNKIMSAMKMNWFVGILVLVLIPVATVSATTIYTDNFDRANSATLGADWSATWEKSQLGISSNMAVPSDSYAHVSAYNVLANGVANVKASVEFQASEALYLGSGLPNLIVGINNTANSWFNGDFFYVQGILGAKLWVDNTWRDIDPASTLSPRLTAGNWYRMTIEQNGADFTGTLATSGGTVLKQHTYHSLAKTSSTGAAYIGYNNFGEVAVSSSPAFDNFSLTIVPEPSTLALLATGLMALLAYAWRKRR